MSEKAAWSEDAMHVAFVVDRNNVLQLAAAMTGMLRRARNDRRIVVHVFHTVCASPAIDRLARAVGAAVNGQLRSVPLAPSHLERFPRVGSIPPVSYARLLLAELLPDAARVIYLDCDLLIRADITDLWEHDLQGMPVGGVTDYAVTRLDSPACLAYCRGELKNPGNRAFNCGVLLVDLNAWRAAGVRERAIAFVERFRGKLYSADQDVLNFLFEGQWCRLPVRWNLPQSLFDDSKRPATTLPEFEAFRADRVRDDAIHHFNGPLKPWNSGVTHPARMQWYADVKSSRWFAPLEWTLWRSKEEARAVLFNVKARFDLRRSVSRRSPISFNTPAPHLESAPRK